MKISEIEVYDTAVLQLDIYTDNTKVMIQKVI